MTNPMEIWNKEIEIVNVALEEFLDLKIAEVTKIGKWHIQFYENVKEYLMRGGKRLRPMLVAAGYKSIKSESDAKFLYRAACSVEILHNGSLLHDDLIDHDEARRGGKTFHATYRDNYLESSKDLEKSTDYGMTMAILGGDSLINLGAQAISASKLAPEVNTACHKYYNDAFEDLVDGVLLEMTMIEDASATLETYLQMVRMKTAVLFEKALLIGAAIAEATQSQLTALSEFGVKVGQAFQIQDDILGSFGDVSVTGKSVDGDIREAKKTMLVFEAYKLVDPNQKKVLDELLGKHDMPDEDVERVRSVFIDSGALNSTKKLMEELLTSGQAALDKAEPALIPEYKDFLIELSNFLTKRDY